MADKSKFDLCGEYTPEPFKFAGDSRTYTIVVAVIAGFITGLILSASGMGNVAENENYPLYNFLILAGVVLLVLGVGYLISKAVYNKNIVIEREEFYKMKKEAEPYMVCEFCGGRIERKFYQGEDTPMSVYRHTKLGVETFVCDECRYLVKGHVCTTYINSSTYKTEYTMVFPEVYETSKVTEEQLTKGRLVAYLRKKERIGFIKKSDS